MTELVRHELRHGAHSHLTEASAEACESQPGGEVCCRACCGCDYESNAAYGVAQNEDDTPAEEVAVSTREDKPNRVCRGVGWDLKSTVSTGAKL